MSSLPPGALDGYRVIDLTTVLMGPLSTRILGDHGADVIRVEAPPASADAEPSVPAIALNIHRNKRSIVLDLKSPTGRDQLLALLDTADVLVTNMRRGALERLGLDADTVRARCPNLIYCAANGFGSTGRYRDKAAYDDAIQASAGLANLFERATDRPAYVPSAIVDKILGLHIAQAVMAALLHRARTGEGQTVEVPMFETMVAFNMVEHHREQTYEPPRGEFGYERVLSKARRPYRTSDGWMCLLPYSDRNWRDFFGFIDRPELADDPRFATHAARVANADAAYGLVADSTPARTTQEWLDLCDEYSVPAMPVLDLGTIMDDPHVTDVGLIEILEHPIEGGYRAVNDSISYSASPTGIRRHSAFVGQHTEEILAELSLDHDG